MRLWNMARSAGMVLALTVIGITAPARANEQVSGTISSVFLSGAYNYAFRVTLQSNGTAVFSGCTGGFAFMNIDDDNYQAKIATLLSAQAQRQTINTTISKDAAGWCRLLEFAVITN